MSSVNLSTVNTVISSASNFDDPGNLHILTKALKESNLGAVFYADAIEDLPSAADTKIGALYYVNELKKLLVRGRDDWESVVLPSSLVDVENYDGGKIYGWGCAVNSLNSLLINTSYFPKTCPTAFIGITQSNFCEIELSETKVTALSEISVGECRAYTWGCYAFTGGIPYNSSCWVRDTIDAASTWCGNHFIYNDNTMYAIGCFFYGSSGLGAGTYFNGLEVQVTGTGWEKVSSKLYSVAALKTDGSLWTWGLNDRGQLGQGNTTNLCFPTRVGTETWCEVSVGGCTMLAIKSDGTLWSWGWNCTGALGVGFRSSSNICAPTKVVTDCSNWCAISISDSVAGGITREGELFAWGNAVATGTGAACGNIDRPAPVISGASNWCRVATAKTGTMAAIKTDGTLWGWGWNNVGQAGNGDYGSGKVQLLPAKVCGIQGRWVEVSGGYATFMAIWK